MTVHRPLNWLSVTRVPIPLACRWPEAPVLDLAAPVAPCGILGDLLVSAAAGPDRPSSTRPVVLCTRHACDLIGPDADDVVAELDAQPALSTLRVATVVPA